MIFRKLNFQKFTGLLVLLFIALSNSISAQFINYQGHANTRGLTTAPDQTIWANASNGLLHYDLNGNLIEVISRSASGDLTTPTSTGADIAIAPNGDIWTASGYGPIRRYDGNTWTTFDNSNTPEIFTNSVGLLEAGPDGTIYAVSYSDISVYQNGEWQTYNLGVFSNGMNATGISPSGELTLAFGRGLATWTAEFGLDFIVGDANGTTPIYDLQYLENGDLYYSTSNGAINRIPSGSTTPAFIAQNTINFPRIAVESDGTVWVGTFAQGNNTVERWDGNQWTVFTPNNSTVTTSAVTDIMVDANDNVYLSQGYFTDDDGLQRFDGNNWDVKYEGFVARGNNSLEQDFDAAGNVYTIGGDQLISKLNPATGAISHFHRGNSPFGGTVRLQSLTATGNNELWVGTQNNGIFHYTGSNWINFTSTTTNGQIPANNIEAIKSAPDGTIYALAIGFSPSVKWLVRYEPAIQSWTNYAEGTDLPEDLNNLYVDANGIAWVTSFNGLSKLENNTITIFTTNNSGLVNNYTDYITGRPDGSEIIFRSRNTSTTAYFSSDGQTIEQYADNIFNGFNGGFSPQGDYFYGGDIFTSGGLTRNDGTDNELFTREDSYIIGAGGGGVLSDPSNGIWYFNESGVAKYTGDDNNPITLNLTSTNITCHDENDGSISVSISGGTPPYQLLFQGEFYTGSNLTFNNLGINFSTGVSVLDANGITIGGSARIFNPAPISPNIFVSGNTITTDASGGTTPYTYLWSNGSTSSNINNTIPGSYIVTITDTNGCSAIGSGSINNNPNTYCESEGDQPWQNWIHTVFLGNINNGDSGKSKYSDFTGQGSTALRTGATQEITLVAQWSYFTWDVYWRVWIDYNQNDVFENSEIAAQTILNAPAAPAPATPAFANITIPQTAALGATRMRVSMKRGAYPEACETFAVGEVEDYTVVIEEGTNGPICPLTGTTSNFTCDDNGTPNNPGDDLYYFDATITAATSNPNSQWRYNNTLYDYNVPVNLGPFPIAQGDENLYIRDINSTNANSCELFLYVDLPIGPCSDGTPPPPTDDCENNLLTNAGFENGLNDWVQAGNVAIISNNVRTGNNAVELGSGSSRVFRSFSTTAGNTFNLKAYLRSGSGNKNAGISIKYMSSSYQPILNETDYFTVGSTYTLFEKTETAPANTAFIEISVRGFGDGELITDDICLTNGEVTPPTNEPDLQVAFGSGNYSGNPGDVASFNFDLTNAGTAIATDSYQIGFVLSTDAMLSSNDVLVGEVPTGSTDIGTTADITGAITIPANTAPGNYFLIARADFDEVITESNESNNTDTQSFTVNGITPPTGEPNCAAESDFPWHEWVSEVTVNGTTKASSKSTYSDFTSTAMMLGKDGNNDISLTAKYSYITEDAYWRVWIDYNQNDVYEADEIFYEAVVSAPASGSGITSVATASSLSIPNDALNGSTSMRVIVARNAFANPCGTFDFGEVEDYTAVIGASSASMRGEEDDFYTDPQLLSLAPNPAMDHVMIGLDKMNGQNFEMIITNQLGQIFLQKSFVENTIDRFNYDTSDLPTGVYFVWLKADGKRSIPQKLIKQQL